MLDYFDGYSSIGLQPIPVYRGTKQPIGVKWNENWSVQRWRNYFELNGNEYNIGILLGKIIDVETDQEEANDLLESILDDTPHPIFQSNRSIHHLFINPDSQLTVAKYKGIEFRGNKVFSVVPPSIHETGSQYKFLKISKFPIPLMPRSLKEFYWENKKKKYEPFQKLKIKKYHKKTICKICEQTKFLHIKRLILEVKVFSEKNLPWMCQQCRKIDIREDCRKLKQR